MWELGFHTQNNGITQNHSIFPFPMCQKPARKVVLLWLWCQRDSFRIDINSNAQMLKRNQDHSRLPQWEFDTFASQLWSFAQFRAAVLIGSCPRADKTDEFQSLSLFRPVQVILMSLLGEPQHGIDNGSSFLFRAIVKRFHRPCSIYRLRAIPI